MSGGAAAASQVWHTRILRAQEAELLFIGDAFKRALERFHEASPAGIKQFPRTLEELVLDARHPVVTRHLRKVYHDPITRRAEWGLVKRDERIVGVYSLSEKTPFSSRDPDGAERHATRYSDWKFMAEVSTVSLSVEQPLP